MKRFKALGALCCSALLAVAAPAHAALLTFTLTGNYNASWDLDSSPVVTGSDADGFLIWNVIGKFPGATYPYVSDITFYTAGAGGGLSIDDPYAVPDGEPPVNLLLADGPQLWSGASANPTFSLGKFDLTENGGGGTYTLTIARASAPVPEPDTWALMIVGFGAVGWSLRAKSRRKADGRLTLSA